MEYVFNELGIDTSILDNVKDVQINSVNIHNLRQRGFINDQKI